MKSILPISGRTLTRPVGEEGAAIVGAVCLPPDFIPTEGFAYIMSKLNGVMSFLCEPVDMSVHTNLALSNIDGQLTNKIWPRTLVPQDVAVRFIPAFPEENIWSVYGAMPSRPHNLADEVWEDVEGGKLTKIHAPVEVRGQTIGQVLTEKAAWPGPEGQLYSLPQTTSLWGENYKRYHKILVDGVRSKINAHEITAKIKMDPDLKLLADKPIDMIYCRFLNQMDLWGELKEDKPARHAELVHRQQMAHAAIASVVNPGFGSKRPTFRHGR